MVKDGKGLVVIAGLSSGVGAGFAREYAEQGYDLLLIARNKKKTDTFTKYLSVLYPNIEISSMIFDITEKGQIEKIKTELGKIKNISTLINCFGYTSHKYFNKKKVRTPKDIITIQDKAAIDISQTTLEIMKKKKYGNIIHVSSLISLFAIGNNPIDATSKIFLNTSSDQLHNIRNDYNISIQLLSPRLTDVDFGKIGKQNFKDKALCVKHVVKKSLYCKKQGDLICIPRFTNKIILTIYNILPRTRSHTLFKRLVD